MSLGTAIPVYNITLDINTLSFTLQYNSHSNSHLLGTFSRFLSATDLQTQLTTDFSDVFDYVKVERYESDVDFHVEYYLLLVPTAADDDNRRLNDNNDSNGNNSNRKLQATNDNALQVDTGAGFVTASTIISENPVVNMDGINSGSFSLTLGDIGCVESQARGVYCDPLLSIESIVVPMPADETAMETAIEQLRDVNKVSVSMTEVPSGIQSDGEFCLSFLCVYLVSLMLRWT